MGAKNLSPRDVRAGALCLVLTGLTLAYVLYLDLHRERALLAGKLQSVEVTREGKPVLYWLAVANDAFSGLGFLGLGLVAYVRARKLR